MNMGMPPKEDYGGRKYRKDKRSSVDVVVELRLFVLDRSRGQFLELVYEVRIFTIPSSHSFPLNCGSSINCDINFIQELDAETRDRPLFVLI